MAEEALVFLEEHNLFLKDVNGDGHTDIIIGGYSYKYQGEQRIAPENPLTIWNWNGKDMTLGTTYQWNTTTSSYISCVYASDADKDENIEIFTGQRVTNQSTNTYQLSVWSWNGTNLNLKTSQELQRTSISSIFVSDQDNDGINEIITCGRKTDDTRISAQLQIWHLNENGLVPQKSIEWCAKKEASSLSVFASEVDKDGLTEIITCGYDHDLQNSTGQIRLWNWNETDLILKENQEWQMTEGQALNIAGSVMGNTIANVVKASDIDGDGFPEIVTGGFTYDGTHANAELSVWRWNEGKLVRVDESNWYTQDVNEVKSLEIEDVDGDGKEEIVACGFFGNPTVWPEPANTLAQLRIWSWDGTNLDLKYSQDWVVDDSATAWTVKTGDIDNDGVTEIVSVGCIYLNSECDPDMRVWSIAEAAPEPQNSSGTFVVGTETAITIIAVACVIVAFAYWIHKKRK